MYRNINEILTKESLNKEDLISLLQCSGNEEQYLFDYAKKVKKDSLGDDVYLRGLVEFSNVCTKNCLYCGIRACNKDVNRYEVSMAELDKSIDLALEYNLGSMVIQSGEVSSKRFEKMILSSVKRIKRRSNDALRITLSCGEQSKETYNKWFDAGAERYLLRIESSNPKIYNKIHPNNRAHSFNERLIALNTLKELGFQTGTGVMIGLPGQSIEDLANDLLFIKNFDVDMVGMGPYIEHPDTPLYSEKGKLLSLQERYDLSLRMIALLRILMKDINIASTTALQSINPHGKRRAIEIGANVLMPNLTPLKYKDSYHLYKNKPGVDTSITDEMDFVNKEVQKAGARIAFGEYGDSKHYTIKMKTF